MNIYIEYTVKNWWHFGENYLYGNPYAKYLSILGSKKQKTSDGEGGEGDGCGHMPQAVLIAGCM